jgi:hypothetical protein
MRIKGILKTHRFKVYIRECKRCLEFTEVPTKKTKYCEKCKAIINKERIDKSLKAREVNKQNGFSRHLTGLNN